MDRDSLMAKADSAKLEKMCMDFILSFDDTSTTQEQKAQLLFDIIMQGGRVNYNNYFDLKNLAAKLARISRNP